MFRTLAKVAENHTEQPLFIWVS